MSWLPAPRIETVLIGDGPSLREIVVVRDDLIEGGTKVRFLLPFIESGREYVYGGPVQGYAQVAVAQACRLRRDAKATVFVAARARMHSRTELARRLGAKIVQISPGYLTTVQKRARDYAASVGARFFPLGFAEEPFIDEISKVGLALGIPAPSEVWCVAGSGALTRGLQRAWPLARHHAVQIGKDPDPGHAQLHIAPERFEQDARGPLPPFPSCSNYDAKAWRFIIEHASSGALFWNVAGN